MRKPLVLAEAAGAVVPPAVLARALVELAKRVDEAELADLVELAALVGMKMHLAAKRFGVEHVALVAGDVEVAAQEHVAPVLALAQRAPQLRRARRASRRTPVS